MIKKIKNLAVKAGVDSAIVFTVFARVIQAFGSVGAIFFVAKYLRGAEQGYYYTFSSILAIQVFFELGLSGILTQYTAHEFAYLKWEDGKLTGDEYYRSRLSSLLHFFVKWFGIVSIILFVALWFSGYYFFSKYNTSTVGINWKMPWLILCLATSSNLFIDPLLAYFDGLGFIKDMSKVRLVQKACNIFLLCLFFVLGFKLYSSALASLISILVNYFQILFSKRRHILGAIWKEKLVHKVNYYKEIFPYQWRIAVSWISGYFIFQLFNPVLFATEGPVVAGQMGMTLQAFNGIAALSMGWMSTKIPFFSALISKRDFLQLDLGFDRTVKSLKIVNFGLLITFIIMIAILGRYFGGLRARFLPTFPLICLSLTVFINQVVNAWAVYMRCHKQEPLMIQAVISAIYCTLSTLILGKFFGLTGLVVGYTAWTVISYFWVGHIFREKKRIWHSEMKPDELSLTKLS